MVQRSSKQGVLEEMGALDENVELTGGRRVFRLLRGVKNRLICLLLSFFVTDVVRLDVLPSLICFFSKKMQPITSSR